MEVQEFGKQNSRKIMLLPGNMMSWRQFEAVIPLLEQHGEQPAVAGTVYKEERGASTWWGIHGREQVAVHRQKKVGL